jgi:polyisoprenyl-phosphate glycosyltransferase
MIGCGIYSLLVNLSSVVEKIIIVPIYNDFDNAKALCQDFLSAGLEGTSLLLVDNGSEGETPLSSLSRMHPTKILTLRLASNVGFGGGIQAGIRATNSDWVIWMPGNMKVLPTRLHGFIQLLVPPNKMAIAKAYRKGRRLIPRLKTGLSSLLQSAASLRIIRDSGGTPTAIHRSNKIFDLILDGPPDYCFESFVMFVAKSSRVPIIRVAVPYGDRLMGQSHWQRGLGSEIFLMLKILRGFRGWADMVGARTRRGEV